MIKSLKSAGLVLCFLIAPFCAPVFAYDIDSYAYADGPDSVSGWSYTDLDEEDWYEDYAWLADVQSTIWLGGAELDYSGAEDFAEEEPDFVFATAYVAAGDGYGWYEVIGDHWEYTLFGWVYLGETSYWAFLAACTLPSGETEGFTFPSPSYGAPFTSFNMTLSPYYFAGRSAQEQWAGGDMYDGCNGDSLPARMNATGPFPINPSDGYIDSIGETAGVVQYRRDLWNGGDTAALPCGFSVFQNMMMLCEDGVTWGIWETIEIDVSVDSVSVTALRNGQGTTFIY